MNYLKQFGTRRVPQRLPLPGQVPNSAGGHAWAVDAWTRLRRFLILGSEGGSYYASEWALTRKNAQSVEEAVREDGRRAVEEIVRVSRAGRAPKNEPALFALALAAGAEDERTRKTALAALPMVARTGTHLFQFATFVEGFRFVVLTDAETWAGDVHPAQALRDYRRASGIDARLVVVGMVANDFTIADPADTGMLDVVGFDTATPQLISDFARGAL